jgi:Holliday junction resolvase RusA-like endonuclease
MKLIAFVQGRPKPQPRVTQNVKFLFGRPVEHWMHVDAENAKKAAMGLLNKKGKPFKATRYAYRLERLQKINEYRRKVFDTVTAACGKDIPYQFLFFFYLFHSPKTWSKKKERAHEWQFHTFKPDYTNLLKGVEDSLYDNDSACNAVAHYKLYVPKEYPEGLLILHDEEIHKYVMETAIDGFIKKGFTC